MRKKRILTEPADLSKGGKCDIIRGKTTESSNGTFLCGMKHSKNRNASLASLSER